MKADNLKEITTSLKPGIYLLDELSEDGIVKLARLMKDFQKYWPYYKVYSRREPLKGIELGHNVDNETRIILLANYDSYYSEENNKVLHEFVEQGIVVLIHCKKSFDTFKDCNLAIVSVIPTGISID